MCPRHFLTVLKKTTFLCSSLQVPQDFRLSHGSLGLCRCRLLHLSRDSFPSRYTLPHKLHKIKYLHLLLVFPFIITILLLVPPLQKYVIIFTDQLIYIPYRDIQEFYQPLFYVHIVYAYLTVLAGITLLGYKAFHSPKNSTTGSKLAMVAAFLFVVQNGFSNFGAKNNNFFWVPSISVILCMILLFFTLYYDHSEQIIFRGQSALLENIPFPILFLNNKLVVIYANEHGADIYNQAKDMNHQTCSSTTPSSSPHSPLSRR